MVIDPISLCDCVPCPDCGRVVTSCPTEDDQAWLNCCTRAQEAALRNGQDIGDAVCAGQPGCKCPCLVGDCCPPDEPVDECGVCGGSGDSCRDCEGGFTGEVYIDPCGKKCGDGNCNGYCEEGEYCSVCIAAVDLCGVCGGNSTTCYGCDGVPASLLEYDDCGICGGNNDTCWGGGDDDTGAIIGTVVAITLATTGAAVGAAIIFRIRKRPDLLTQEWDALLDEHLEQLYQNPLAAESTANTNPLQNMDGGGDLGDF